MIPWKRDLAALFGFCGAGILDISGGWIEQLALGRHALLYSLLGSQVLFSLALMGFPFGVLLLIFFGVKADVPDT